jgi:membrane-bound metal-dependent hydrolase YbcI (DUF457 family)
VEPFSHALTSFALARAGQKRLPRFGTAMLIVAGVAPDLDYASYFGGASAFMRFHRTVAHSLLGATVMACAIAAAFCVLDRKEPRKPPHSYSGPSLNFLAAFFVCAIGACGHILLDLCSSNGVQLLWPFHLHWYGWDVAPNLDPLILALLVAGLLLPLLFKLVNEEVTSGQKKRSGATAAVITLVLLIGYLGMRARFHGEAVDLLYSREYHGRVPLSADAFPTPLSPFTWRGVVGTDNTMEEVEVPLRGNRFDPNDSTTVYKPEDSPALEIAQKTAAAGQFLEYARVPVANVRHIEADYRVEIRDLRFPADDDGPSNIILRVDLSSDLRIRREEFLFASTANSQ